MSAAPKAGDVVTDAATGVTTHYKDWGRLVVYPSGELVPIIKDRHLYVQDEDWSLTPGSLIGSAFHVLVGGEMIWQGIVCGEPVEGRYLCQIDKLDAHTEAVQRIFTLDTLMGLGEEAKRLIEGSMAEAKAPIIEPYVEWRMYDSVRQAREAYQQWALSRAMPKGRDLTTEEQKEVE